MLIGVSLLGGRGGGWNLGSSCRVLQNGSLTLDLIITRVSESTVSDVIVERNDTLA